MDLYAVWLDMNVYLLIVVAFKGHLGMNSLFGITESSFWLAKVALQENIRNTKVELIRWVVPVQKGYEYEFFSFSSLRKAHLRRGVSVL